MDNVANMKNHKKTNYRTLSPVDNRWTNNGADLELLLLLLSDDIFSILLHMLIGAPLVTWCWGVASGTRRLRKPELQPHGKTL